MSIFILVLVLVLVLVVVVVVVVIEIPLSLSSMASQFISYLVPVNSMCLSSNSSISSSSCTVIVGIIRVYLVVTRRNNSLDWIDFFLRLMVLGKVESTGRLSDTRRSTPYCDGRKDGAELFISLGFLLLADTMCQLSLDVAVDEWGGSSLVLVGFYWGLAVMVNPIDQLSISLAWLFSQNETEYNRGFWPVNNMVESTFEEK